MTIDMSFGYWLDCYDAKNMLLARFTMIGALGEFTSAKLHSVSRDGTCAKIGLWGPAYIEVYRTASGTGLDGDFNSAMMQYTNVTLTNATLTFINTNLCGAAGSGVKSRSNGCWCGAWLGGGIHEDWCAPGLAGKSCLPAE